VFKLTPKKVNCVVLEFRLLFRCFLLFLTLLTVTVHAQFLPSAGAIVNQIVNEQTLIANSDTNLWDIGEILPIISQNSKIGVFAFVEVQNLRNLGNGHYELKLKLLRQSRKYMIQKGDLVKKLDLSTANDDFVGTTDLLVKGSERSVSAKYRPLVYQGLSIGDTAQVLYKDEFLVNYLGNLSYGATDWLTLGTFVPVNLIGRPNANFRARFYDSESTTLSTGLSFVRLVSEKQANLNANFYWDSTSSDNLISHTFLSLSLMTWDGSAEASAFKALTSSTFQTGYELITSNWDRVLIGPSYNFQNKSLGGYLSYIWIYDRFHAQLSINSTDITHFRFDIKDGYYGFFDFYWRF